jgi:hypothetical protein
MPMRACAAAFLALFALSGAPAWSQDEEPPPTLTITAIQHVEALSSEEDGQAFAVLGPVTAGQEGVFRVHAQRMVVWLHPDFGGRVLSIIEGLKSEEQQLPLWAVRAVYAEGGRTPAVFHVEGNIFRCSSLFFDLTHHKGLVMDASLRIGIKTGWREREIPDLVLRAKRFLAVGPGEWTGEEVRAYSSEYQDPEIWLELRRVTLKDENVKALFGDLRRLSAKGAEGEADGVAADEIAEFLAELEKAAMETSGKEIQFRKVKARAFGVPFFYWPKIDVDPDGVGMRFDVRIGRYGRLDNGIWIGAGIARKEVAFMVGAGYYHERGPLLTGDLALNLFDGKVKGTSLGAWLRDHGDETGLDQPTRDRYWVQNRYRWQIDPIWRLDGEYSDLSDPTFLLVYDEQNFKEGKDQETLLNLRGRGDYGYITTLVKGRTIDFQAVTEELPTFRGHLPVLTLWRFAETGRGDPVALQLSGNLEAGRLEHLPGILDLRPRFSTDRIYADPTLFVSFDLGPVRVVPFGTLLFTNYSETLDNGARTRWAGQAGIRTDAQMARWYGNTRHVMNFALAYVELFGLSAQPDEFFQFDSIDAMSEFQQVRFRWRNRLLRGHPDTGAMEFLSFETLILWSPNEEQPLGRTGDGWLEFDFEWQVKRDFATYFQTSQSFDTGRIETGAIGAEWQVTRDFHFAADFRHLHGVTDTFTAATIVELDRRWSIAMFNQFDLKNGDALDQVLRIQRIGKTAVFGIRFVHDPGVVDFGVGVTIDLLHLYRAKQARREGDIRSEVGWQ